MPDHCAWRAAARPSTGLADAWALAADACGKPHVPPFAGQNALRVRRYSDRGSRLQRAYTLRLSMDAGQPPFRAEVIGSLLRPRALKDAVALQQAGLLSPTETEAVLDREVARVIARQEAIGFRVVTDGELARTS